MKRIFIVAFLLPSLLFSQEVKEDTVSIGKLKGTLTVPSKKTETAILLIAGSGPTDRNGNSVMGLNNNSLKFVAENLTAAGFSVLRYDKRGIAASAAAVSNPSSLRFENFVEDAVSWLDFLDSQGYQQLIVVGHSQGSLVGILAAAKFKKVAGFISISGPAEDAATVIVNQIAAQSTELAKDAEINLDSLKKGFTVTKYSPYLISIFNPGVQDFLRSYMKYDPSSEIKKLDIPVLLVNGTTDIQVNKSHAKALQKAYPAARLLIIDGMNHVLKDAPEDNLTANMMTYSNPDLPLSAGLVEGMVSFIKSL